MSIYDALWIIIPLWIFVDEVLAIIAAIIIGVIILTDGGISKVKSDVKNTVIEWSQEATSGLGSKGEQNTTEPTTRNGSETTDWN